MQRIKQEYFDLVGTKKFIGVQPMTLCADDVGRISASKDDWWYLVKFDGVRRIIYISKRNIFLIDRRNYFTHMKKWRWPSDDTLICDGELLEVNGSPVIKVFDLMYINGSVERKLFTERLELLRHYVLESRIRVPDWFILSKPYHLSSLAQHLNSSGGIIGHYNGFSVDGIVPMRNHPYIRGTSSDCLKFKNEEFSTMDLEVMDISAETKDGLIAELGCVQFGVVDSYKVSSIPRDFIIQYEKDTKSKFQVGKIIEFKYDKMIGSLVPFRDRSEKSNPNAFITVENVWESIINPVNPTTIVNIYQYQMEPLKTIVMKPPPETVLAKLKILEKKQIFQEKKNNLDSLHKRKLDTLKVLSLPPLENIKTEEVEAQEPVINIRAANGNVIPIDILQFPQPANNSARIKLGEILSGYIDNFDEYDSPNSNIELEFKFGIPNKDGRYENGITMAHYEMLLSSLKNDFATSGNITETLEISYNYNKYNIRETVNSNGEVKCMKKTKLQFGEFYTRFVEFNANNKLIIRGTLSQELDINSYNLDRLVGTRPHRENQADVARQKERISFQMDNYSIDLTLVTNLDTNEKTAELEIELNTLSLDDLSNVFNGNGVDGMSDDYINDILGTFTYILGIVEPLEDALEDVHCSQKNKKVKNDGYFERTPILNVTNSSYQPSFKNLKGKRPFGGWELQDTRTYATKSHQDGVQYIKKIIWSLPNSWKIQDDVKVSIIQLSNNYWTSLFQVYRDDGGILKGKSKKDILDAIVYIAISDIGIKLTQIEYIQMVCSRVSTREFIKSYAISMKYITRNKELQKIVTLENYIENVVESFTELHKFRRNLKALYDEVVPLTNNEQLLKYKCNDIVCLCIFVHCKYDVNLNDLLELVHYKISKADIIKCKDIMKILLEDNNQTSQVAKEPVQNFQISTLTLNLVTTSSNFKDFKINPQDFNKIQLKQLRKISKTIQTGEFENSKMSIQNGVNIVKCAIKQDRWNMLAGDDDTKKFLLYMDVFRIINFDKFFENFITTSTFKAIRFGTQEPKVFQNGQCKPIRQRKNKSSNYDMFQNAIQLIINLNNCEYDVKVFMNGKINIAGCQDTTTGPLIAQLVVAKINDTKDATAYSEFSTVISNDFKIPAEYQNVTFSLLNAAAKTNIKLRPTANDIFGLQKVCDVIETKYSHILVRENHPQLKSDQRPLTLPPPDTKAGKRVIIKIAGANNNITTVQLHSTGALNFSAKSEKELVDAYETIAKIIKNDIHYNYI